MRWTLAGAMVLGAVGCAKPDHIETKPIDMTFNRRGEELWAQAIFKDHQGNVYVKQPAIWSSSDDKVATVDNKAKPGNVTAVGPGHQPSPCEERAGSRRRSASR